MCGFSFVDILGRVGAAAELPTPQFVEKRLIAYIQLAPGLFAIPVHLFKGGKNYFLFGPPRRNRREFLKRSVFPWRGSLARRRCGSLHFGKRVIQVGKYQIAFDRILKLANVAGPAESRESMFQFRREL